MQSPGSCTKEYIAYALREKSQAKECVLCVEKSRKSYCEILGRKLEGSLLPALLLIVLRQVLAQLLPGNLAFCLTVYEETHFHISKSLVTKKSAQIFMYLLPFFHS